LIEFRFPYILFLYIPFFLILFVDIVRSKKIKILSNTPENIKKVLFEKIDLKKAKIKQNLILLSISILIFAASGPQIGIRLAPIDRKGLDLVFCIDVSSSMRGTDIKPTRLDKSKFEVSQMIQNLKGDRVAIIFFAGTSHLYLPLTTLYSGSSINSIKGSVSDAFQFVFISLFLASSVSLASRINLITLSIFSTATANPAIM